MRAPPPLEPLEVARLARAAGPPPGRITGDGSARVSGLAYDSRRAAPGDLFFCVVGHESDGHDHAAAAVASGAAALVVERPLGLDVPQILVPDVRKAMSRIAAQFLDLPADDLQMIGVTGTNGKTTTAYLLESILRAAGRTTGLIGTIETRIGAETRPGVRTTPESLDLQILLHEMRAAGVEAVAMEVTSHGLALHRVEGIRFLSAAFTNLSQDHLDFHRDMEDYFQAKRRLFRPERLRRGAANADDPYGRKLLSEQAVPCIGFGHSSGAEVRASDVSLEPWGNEFVITVSGEDIEPGELKISSPLVGAFNVSNCLAACSAALQAGISLDAVEAGLRSLKAVPGRFEAVDRGQPFTVVVDYAHTPDSLDNVLREARRLAEQHGGRVVCAFGCGGDRDRAKRPLMGAVAGRLADISVITSDNPRSEDPRAIIAEILEGLAAERPAGPDAVMVDRAAAIGHALRAARAGDVVAICGKGHETGQEFADRTVPFDDRAVVAGVLREMGWNAVPLGGSPR